MNRSPRKSLKRDYKALHSDGVEGSSPSKVARKSLSGSSDQCNKSPTKHLLGKTSPRKSTIHQTSPSKSLKSPKQLCEKTTTHQKSPSKSLKSPPKSPIKSPLKSLPKSQSPSKSLKSPLKSPKQLCEKTTTHQKSPSKLLKTPPKSPIKSPLKSLPKSHTPLKSRPLFSDIGRSVGPDNNIIHGHGKSEIGNKLPSTPQKTPQKSAAVFYGSPKKTPQKVVRMAPFDDASPRKMLKKSGSCMDIIQVKSLTATMPKRKPLKDKPKGNIKELYESLPCRHKELDLLLSLFGERDDDVWPGLFLYGHTATGKTKVVTSIMNNQQLPHVIVNLVECYTNRLMYEHILNSILDKRPSPENDYATYSRCDNMNDFIICFKKVVKERALEDETIYIVLDHAERLRDMDAYILPAFTRLQELTQCKVCVILISEIVWEKFRFGTGCLEPIIVHFPDYTQDNLMDIMLLDCPHDRDEDFYSSYLNLLLSVFYSACRDLRELRHLAALNFPKYIEPINTGEAKESESRKLWRNIEPHLKKALHSVYLREVSSAQWEKMQQQSGEGTAASTNVPVQTSRMHVELPYYSKYLLIAAYLASYNPAKSDQRFFTKRAEKKVSRQAKLVKKNERTSSQLLGPKAFPLDRLMAIFYSIVEGKVLPTAYVYSQIASLVTLRLIAHVGGDDQLDGPKYKCVISLEFIKSVSRTVSFEVMRYLYDFI